MASVGVILTVLNESGSIAELLDAFLSQSLPPSEIVIVDGGSRDGTLEILTEYRKYVAPMYIKYIEPFKHECDLIIPNHTHLNKALEVLIHHLTVCLKERL